EFKAFDCSTQCKGLDTDALILKRLANGLKQRIVQLVPADDAMQLAQKPGEFTAVPLNRRCRRCRRCGHGGICARTETGRSRLPHHVLHAFTRVLYGGAKNWHMLTDERFISKTQLLLH